MADTETAAQSGFTSRRETAGGHFGPEKLTPFERVVNSPRLPYPIAALVFALILSGRADHPRPPPVLEPLEPGEHVFISLDSHTGPGVGPVLWIQFGNVKEGRMKDFQKWTKENENLLSKHAPPGWAYRGTFGTVLGFGRYDTAMIMECGKYGDFDNLREHKDETWNRLGQEATEFFLPGQQEAILLREIGDVKIMEPLKKKK